jgi:GIY-YIG catalytic domain
MATDFKFRKQEVKKLTTSIGAYVLCDLDNVPIYVGKTADSIRARVSRHLTSARSDIIANRQIDVWEIAYVWTFPVTDATQLDSLEAKLFRRYDSKSQLFNGTRPKTPVTATGRIPRPAQRIQVMSDQEITDRKDAVQRLPRQASHYAQLVDHFLAVKNSKQVARAMAAHFQRLQKYHGVLLKTAVEDREPEDT